MLTTAMPTHDERLDAIETTLRRVDLTLCDVKRDVRSLLDTRSFVRGVWYAVGVVSGIVSAVVALVMGYIRGN